jgi:hypothetical protein
MREKRGERERGRERERKKKRERTCVARWRTTKKAAAIYTVP